MATFSDRLRELREENGVTMQQLADAVSTTKSTISRYEAGMHKPRQELLEEIASYFNVSVDYLLGKTKERKSADDIIGEENTDLEELMQRYDVHFNGEVISDKDKQDIIEFLRMLKNRD